MNEGDGGWGGEQPILQMETLRAEHATNSMALGAKPLALPVIGAPWAAVSLAVSI